jgi:hypothetical protein
MDMINIYCVLVKPGYNIQWVERLYGLCKKYLSYDFTFTCLTDQENISNFPIEFIRVEQYELDTWWNKMLIFKDNISKEGINLYFDLDIDISNNIDELINQIEKEKLCLVDTPWKNTHDYFNHALRNSSAFIEYGNTSVMGWISKSQTYLFKYFHNDIFKHTSEHFGDDTFINRNANKKYFSNIVGLQNSIINIRKKTF